MRARLKRLQQVAALYGVVERMDAVELQRAESVVREAELAIETQRTIAHSAGLDGRQALVMEDRMGWSLAEMEREIAEWKQVQFEEIRQEREELSEAARERYAVSRLKSEKMNSVVDDVAERVETEEGRRFQATTDDRFLSRKLWMETREKGRQESR